MKQQTRVPEFGKWENADNVSYTQYFDNARTKRTPGRMINPNDPTQNPEAFLGTEPRARKPKDARKQEADPRQKRNSSQSTRGSKVSGGVRSQAHGHDAKTTERPRRRHGGRGNVTPEREFVVPPFGKWDESNPKSGDKYTGIFEKLREDRQSPMFEPPCPTIGRDYDRSPRVKRFLCFSWRAK
uniref:RIN4 pathogenic type III effector avirulence factor Avr cleavage site domain-containing protein n=1 Tax=Ananas comosus var. bracteatus TaxID=296719 RepID=A0A6V7P0T5_ANACO|nr:unnamed protein product [Ananas comosus var. bracteatus]